MIEPLGNFSIVAVLVLSVAGAAAGLSAWFARERRWTTLARWSVWAAPIALTVTSAALLLALVRSDMRFEYVASYTERSLPLSYKLAAFWAGQEGSLLLWAWMLSLMSAIAATARRKLDAPGEPITLAALAGANAFFAALLLFAANPFLLLQGGPAVDGAGLNPMLQHWAMVLHPPTLFLGYAGFTIPFAILLGSLVAEPDSVNSLPSQVRRWVLASWLFLGAGIMLGAWWAYVELGWGGYWAWDPVENASLLPWLTGTALLHTLVIHQQRGSFRIWTASLITITFVLCIFGTYLTRSGVIQSVHAFGESAIGDFFLGFILLTGALGAGVTIWRRRRLRSAPFTGGVLSREGMFLVGNILFLLMTATVLIGTIMPLLTGVFSEKPVSVGQEFYNRMIVPMALLLAGVMALGPLLVYGKNAAESVRRGVIAPAIATALALLVAAALGLRNPTALVCLGITTMAFIVIGVGFHHSVRAQRRLRGDGMLTAAVRMIDANHRRYGGQLSHVGMILVIIGVAGSNLFAMETTLTMSPGETAAVGDRVLRYEGLREERGPNYTAVVAAVHLTTAGGREVELSPQRRFYDKAENPSAEVSIRSNFREDLYVILAGWEDGGRTVAIQALVNPLTMWIWIGTGVMLFAGCFCMLPRLLPRPVAARMRAAGAAERPARAAAPAPAQPREPVAVS